MKIQGIVSFVVIRFAFCFALTFSYAEPLFAKNTDPEIDKIEFHQDYRNTAKFVVKPDFSARQPLTGESLARHYLQENAELFGLKPDLSDLKLSRVQESISLTHYYFSQIEAGVEVYSGEVIVSLNKNLDSIIQVFNNYLPLSDIESQRSTGIDKEKAYDLVWQQLFVSGNLLSKPKIKEVYFVESTHGKVSLSYSVNLHLSEPYGDWLHFIDLKSGKILKFKNQALDLNPKMFAPLEEFNPKTAAKPFKNRQVAFKEFQLKEKQRFELERLERGSDINAVTRASASALVFDPDPMTVLKNANLNHNSSLDQFEGAYSNVELLDLELINGKYHLSGPWVKLMDFESPFVQPSTSVNGVWDVKKDNVAFQDVMTYYHLDSNQRYIQSLGFVAEKGIQHAPIQVDANGLSGQDNSHYIPSSNRMAFGHGCVPDNEDADVILHEYGHAINFSINRNWGGGDTGAMGEGFGDYWAGSYSLSKLDEENFQINKVFNWDGVPGCWPGRKLDAVEIIYEHSRNYGPHSSLGNGRQSDELWSAPLFQSLLQLVGQGIPREEVDTIILEAQFGLGRNIKMRDMAKAIVATAKRLFPDGPHASVFTANFSRQKILEVPSPQLKLKDIEVSPEDADVILPGSIFELKFYIENKGSARAENIYFKLLSLDQNAEIISGEGSFNVINVNDIVSNDQPLKIKIKESFPCGEKLKLKIALHSNDSITLSEIFDLELPVGRNQGLFKQNTNSISIPDENAQGIKSYIEFDSNTSFLVSDSFKVDLSIKHTSASDLEVRLISPSGKIVKLHYLSTSSVTGIEGTYPTTLSSSESLESLSGESLGGVWTLHVIDHAALDIGTLVSWAISDSQGYICTGR